MRGRLLAWLLALLGGLVSRLGGWREDDADEEHDERGIFTGAGWGAAS